MSWIRTIDEENASEILKEIYGKISGKRGRISNILKVHSLIPETMQSHLELYMTIMFSNSLLSREQQELIAVVVSVTNKCDYCINHHAEALNHYWKDSEMVKQLLVDFRKVSLPEKCLIMLQYSEKLTLSPHRITEDDMEILRNAGFSDEQILSINLTTSYFNFVNRIALGLGVQFSEKEKSGYKY